MQANTDHDIVKNSESINLKVQQVLDMVIAMGKANIENPVVRKYCNSAINSLLKVDSTMGFLVAYFEDKG